MTTYTVQVTREDGHWLAEVADVPGAHTYAQSLVSLHRNIREVITLMADHPDSAVDDDDAFTVRLDFTDVVGEVVEPVRELREHIAKLQVELAERTSIVLESLDREGLSVRDEAQLLGVSHQRIQQLRKERRVA